MEECTYKIDVNSIYKGNPILHSPDFIAGYRNDEKHAKALKVIYIKRECFSGENCLGRNQNIILFLKKIENRDLKTEEYELADRLFGMQSFNWNLAKETRRMSLMSAE